MRTQGYFTGFVRTPLILGALCCATAVQGQDAQILILDSSDKVVRFDYPSGEAFDHFVGSGLTTLEDGRSLMYGPDGNLYVTSWGTNSVLRYDGLTGRFIDEFVAPASGGLSEPTDAVFGPDGNLYVTSWRTSSVLRYDGTTGEFIDTFVQGGAGTLRDPTALAFDPEDNLLVASISNSVLRYDGTSGEFLDVAVPVGAGGLNHLSDLLFDEAGRLYISGLHSGNIVVVPPEGEPEVLVTAGVHRPQQMAIAPDGALVVATGEPTASAKKFDRFTGEPLGTPIPGRAGGLDEDRIGLVFVPTQPEECRADFNGDGVLDFFDFLAFQQEFAAGCP